MVATSDQNHSYVKCPSHRKSTQNTNGKFIKCKEVCNRALKNNFFETVYGYQIQIVLLLILYEN